MGRPLKIIKDDASFENARLIVVAAKLKETIQKQQNAIFDIEQLALEANDKKTLQIISTLRNDTKGEK